jgi:parallel beta-helix repeat protein
MKWGDRMKINRNVLILCIFIFLITFTVGNPQPSVKANAYAFAQSGPFLSYLPIVQKQELPGYVVSPNGSDTNPGTSLRPWRTIGKAARTVVPGDTVYVHAGIYNEAVNLNVSGTEQKPINFLAYPGETPIIDGNNQLPTNWTGLITVNGDWIRISGFEVRNSTYVGVQLHGRHDRVDQIFSHHNQRNGIYVQGDFGTVEFSRLWRNAMVNENNKVGDGSPALATARDTQNGITDYAVLRNNTVWENWGIGIDTFESNGTIIEGNTVHDNLVGNIYISDATNIICNRNFIFMTPGSVTYGLNANFGILLGDETYDPASANITIINNIAYGNLKNLSWYSGVQGGGMNNVLIANNTFANVMPNDGGHRNVDISSGSHHNVRFMNNIILQDDSQHIEDIAIDPNIVISHNLWSKPPRDAILGTGDIVADPELARTGTPYDYTWFKLTSGSPAIDHALSLPEIKMDFVRSLRGIHRDLGAFEYLY